MFGVYGYCPYTPVRLLEVNKPEAQEVRHVTIGEGVHSVPCAWKAVDNFEEVSLSDSPRNGKSHPFTLALCMDDTRLHVLVEAAKFDNAAVGRNVEQLLVVGSAVLAQKCYASPFGRIARGKCKDDHRTTQPDLTCVRDLCHDYLFCVRSVRRYS